MTTPINTDGSDQLNQLFGADSIEEAAQKKKAAAYKKLLEDLQDPNLAAAVYESMLNPKIDEGGPLGLLTMYQNNDVEANASDPGSPSNLLFPQRSDGTSAA